MSRAITIYDNTDTGLRWQGDYASPLPKGVWPLGECTRSIAVDVRRLVRAGWEVTVLGDGPGSSALRAIAGGAS